MHLVEFFHSSLFSYTFGTLKKYVVVGSTLNYVGSQITSNYLVLKRYHSPGGRVLSKSYLITASPLIRLSFLDEFYLLSAATDTTTERRDDKNFL